MRRAMMISLLALCGFVAIYPSFVWLTARIFDAVDDRWLLTLGLTAFTVPMALALAAVVLAVHGLLLNRAFQAEASEEFEELREREREMVAAMASGGGGVAEGGGAGLPAGASVSATRDRGSRGTAKAPRTERSKGDRLKRRAAATGRRKMRQSFRWFR